MAAEALAVVLAISCLFSVSAQPLVVPASWAPEPVKTIAQYDTLYPNPSIDQSLCVYEQKGQANVVSVHSAHIPTSINPDKNLFIQLATGGNPLINDASEAIIVDIENPRQWEVVNTTESIFCGATVHTNDGRIVQIGGHVLRTVYNNQRQVLNYTEGLNGIRILAPLADVDHTLMKRVNTMQSKRWYPLLHLLADGKILIGGGTSGASNGALGVTFAEVFDPAQPAAPTQRIDMPAAWLASFENKPFYPIMWHLPTGHVFMFADSNSCILNHHTGKCLTDNTGKLISPATRPGNWASTYPFTGSGVMLTMTPDDTNRINQVDIVIFGGVRRSDHPQHTVDWGGGFNYTALAGRYSHRLTISWTRTSETDPWQYTFSDWTEEDMGIPRVMPDATLLPNGDVVVANGAQAGVAGYPRRNFSMSNYPAFWAELYQPDLPADGRYTLLCGTQQVRAYHGTATLTSEGKMLISGDDRPRFYLPMPEVPWFKDGTGSTTPPAYNIEIFHPPYVYDTANKPEIMKINGASPYNIPEMDYNTEFTLEYGPGPNATKVDVSSVVLVAPSSTTHSCNMNQRVIQLIFKKNPEGSLTVTTPFHPYYAVPQYYMLFVNNVKTYSRAKWIRLVDSKNEGAVAPLP